MNNSIHAPGASWETIRAARARRESPPPFVTDMQDQIKNLQRVAIKAAFYFYLPHSDDAYDEVLEALDAAGYKRPDEDGYLGGVK